MKKENKGIFVADWSGETKWVDFKLILLKKVWDTVCDFVKPYGKHCFLATTGFISTLILLFPLLYHYLHLTNHVLRTVLLAAAIGFISKHVSSLSLPLIFVVLIRYFRLSIQSCSDERPNRAASFLKTVGHFLTLLCIISIKAGEEKDEQI